MLKLKSAMLYVGIIMFIKSLAGLAALKVQALLILPEGFAALGQFMTITGLVSNISSAAITTGMTVLLSRANAGEELNQTIRSGQIFAAILSCLISFCCLLLFFLGAGSLGMASLPRYLFLILAVAPWLITRSSIVQAQLTSSYQLNVFAKLNNASAVTVAFSIIVLTYFYGVTGSAIAVAVGPIVVAGFLIVFGSEKSSGRSIVGLPNSRNGDIRELAKFSMAMLVAVCAVPISHILIRSGMANEGLVEQAGYWSAVVRLSDIYMQFFGLLLTFYVLPKISSKKSLVEIKSQFLSHLGRLACLAIGVLCVVYVLREHLVSIALSSEFWPVTQLLPIQLAADFFRIILSFFFWFLYAHNMRTLAALEEVVQATSFWLLAFMGFSASGAQGIIYAHLFASIFTMVVIGGYLFMFLLRSR